MIITIISLINITITMLIIKRIMFKYEVKKSHVIPGISTISKKISKLYRTLPDWMLSNKKVLFTVLLSFCMMNILLLVISINSIGFEKQEVTKIIRPSYGESAQIEQLEVTAEYKGILIRKSSGVNIESKILTEEEKKKKLELCKKNIKTLIKGENDKLSDIKKPLNLITKDINNNINISWESNNPKLVNEQGLINILEAIENPYAKLTGTLEIDGMTDTWECIVKVSYSEERIEAAINELIDKTFENIALDQYGNELILPKDIQGIIKLEWHKSNRNIEMLIIFGWFLFIILLYSERKFVLKKKEQLHKQKIKMELPDFLNKLTLLLSAGLVITDGIEKITVDYNKHRVNSNKKILYEYLSEIQNKLKYSNASLTTELISLSNQLGINELTRLSVIVADNIEKGNALSDKLEAEAILLFKEQKSHIEELGKIADTKLTFPLIIILIVLIVIVISPALLGF